jgi:hypothetical protein
MALEGTESTYTESHRQYFLRNKEKIYEKDRKNKALRNKRYLKRKKAALKAAHKSLERLKIRDRVYTAIEDSFKEPS